MFARSEFIGPRTARSVILLSSVLILGGCSADGGGTRCEELYGTVDGAERTLHVGVGCRYAAIHFALNVAESGDAIMVTPGTYRETVVIDKAITLVGSAGPLIRGAVHTSADVTLTDLTISDSSGDALIVHEGRVTLSGVAITRAQKTTVPARGLVVRGDATVEANDLTVSGSEGPGIVVESGTLTITDGTLRANDGGLAVIGGAATVENLAVTNNRFYGLAVTNGSLTVTGDSRVGESIAGLTAGELVPSGDGVIVGTGGTLTATNLRLENNARCGLLVDSGTATLDTVSLSDNGDSTVAVRGRGIQVQNGSLTATGLIAHGSAHTGLLALNATVAITGTTISGSRAVPAIDQVDVEGAPLDFGDGLAVLGGTISVQNLALSGHPRAGALFDGASGDTFGGNTVADNGTALVLQNNTATPPVDANALETGFGQAPVDAGLTVDREPLVLPPLPALPEG